MYHHISGMLELPDSSTAVLDAGGVGYKLTVSGNTLGAIADKVGSDVRLLTYLSVKEDALDLYGFATSEELAIFKMLISVSGIGAKSAISVLSLMTPEKFALAVTTGDAKAISKAQGIGAKTAARIVLELKDKVAKEVSAPDASVIFESGLPYAKDKLSEAANALMVLGYTKSEAASALSSIDPGVTELEDMIREALKKLMK